MAPGLLSPTWSISVLQEIHRSLTWQTLGGWLIQGLNLSILPAVGSSPGCLCSQLSWAEGRARPLSHPHCRGPSTASPSGPKEAHTLVLKKERWALTSSFPWRCGIQSTTQVKDIFLSNPLLILNFFTYSSILCPQCRYRAQGFWATDWIWGSLLVNSTPGECSFLRYLVVARPTSPQIAYLTHVQYAPLIMLASIKCRTQSQIILYMDPSSGTILISASPTSLKLPSLMAWAESDVTASLSVWDTRRHKVCLACQGPSMIDPKRPRTAAVSYYLFPPYSLPVFLKVPSASIQAWCHGCHILCTIAMALKAFPCYK